MKVGASIIAVVVVAVVAMLLIFGGDDPELSSQDRPTPTATASATATPAATVDGAAVLGVRIGDQKLQVAPTTITRDGRTLSLAYENTTDAAIEVVFARGAPRGAKAIQRDLITGAVIQAGQPRRDTVRVDPGRYTLLLRSPDESKPPTDTVSVEVR
ncbi:MAG TPA: hypothetical protein VI300_18775 [Solirubrobacter sp.]